jgi:hypothetical protein
MQTITIGLSKSMYDGTANGISMIHGPTEKWVLALRKGVNSRDAKPLVLARAGTRLSKSFSLYCPQIHLRRLDHLLHLLYTHVMCKLLMRQLSHKTGVPLPSGLRVCVHMSYGHPSLNGQTYDIVSSTLAMQPCRSSQLSMTMQAVVMCTEVQLLADGRFDRMAEKAVLAALQKAIWDFSKQHRQAGQPPLRPCCWVATVLLSGATPACSESVQIAALSSAAPHNVSWVLEGAATAGAANKQQSAMVLAVEQLLHGCTLQGAAKLHGQAASEMAVAGVVTVADIQPVNWTF